MNVRISLAEALLAAILVALVIALFEGFPAF